MHSIRLTDEQYERLTAAAKQQGRQPEELVVTLIEKLPIYGEDGLSELGRSFMARIDQLVAEGKIPYADPDLNEGLSEYDAAIADEIARQHGYGKK